MAFLVSLNIFGGQASFGWRARFELRGGIGVSFLEFCWRRRSRKDVSVATQKRFIVRSVFCWNEFFCLLFCSNFLVYGGILGLNNSSVYHEKWSLVFLLLRFGKISTDFSSAWGVLLRFGKFSAAFYSAWGVSLRFCKFSATFYSAWGNIADASNVAERQHFVLGRFFVNTCCYNTSALVLMIIGDLISLRRWWYHNFWLYRSVYVNLRRFHDHLLQLNRTRAIFRTCQA